jgi:MFS family permease
MALDDIALQKAAAGSEGSYRWVVLGVATIAQATASFVILGFGVLAGFLQQDFHLDASQIGLLIGAAGAAPVIALPLVGDLLDQRGERLIVGFGAAVVAAGLVLAALAPNFVSLLIFLFVVGIGYSASQPGGSKSVTAWFRGDRLGFAVGIRQAGLPLGGAAAAAILPVIASLWSWRVAFVFGAAVALAGGLAFSAVYRAPATANGTVHRRAPAKSRWHLFSMLRHPWMRSAAVSGITLVGAQYAIISYFMLSLRDEQAIPLVEGARLMFVTQLCGVAGRVLLAAWSDRIGASRFRLVVASMVAVGVGLLTLAILPTHVPMPVLLVVAAWLGFFGLGWYGPWVAFVADIAPPENLGLALGTAMALNQIAIMAAPPLLGLLHDAAGGYATIWSCMAVLVIAAIAGTRRLR